MKKAIYFLCAFVLLSACSVKKHTVTSTQQQSQTTGSHTSVQALQSFDSLLHTLDFSADSVIIELTQTALSDTTKTAEPTTAKRSSKRSVGGATGKPVAPGIKITAHQPRVRSTKQANNRVFAQKVEQDSAASSVLANSHADTSKDVVGVATPMNGTIVTVIVLLAVLLIAATALWLFLRKYRII